MNEIKNSRDLLNELFEGNLSEAELRYQGEVYYVDDNDMPEIIGTRNIKSASSILKDRRWTASALGGFDEDVRKRAAIILEQHPSEINEFRGRGLSPTPGSSITITEAWQKKLFEVSTGDREGAIGKGEVLACFMFPGLRAAPGGEKGHDVYYRGGEKYSVKQDSSPASSAEFKLNGVIGDFNSQLEAEFQRRVPSGQGDEGIAQDYIAFANKTVRNSDKSSMNVGTIGKALDDIKVPEVQSRILTDFVLSCDKVVRDISAGHDFIFFTGEVSNLTMHVVKGSKIYYSSLDKGQAKVGIRMSPGGRLFKSVEAARKASTADMPSVASPASQAPTTNEAVTSGGVGGPSTTGDIRGVTTPLGTDASGGKGGPGVRKGKGKSILDRNAKSQGKFFGRAKRVNESSTYTSLGRYLYTDVEFGDYDLDKDGEGDLESNSIFRGGGGNLGKNAATTGKSFAGAKPVKASKVLKETTELLNELLPPTRGITRQKPSLMAAISGLHPQVLDETHVRLVLGMKPLSLNEGHVNEAHLRAILREQLIYEGWWDSAKQMLGQGIDKIKEKAEDAADAVKAFGNNTKGVVAGLWVAASDGKLLEAITKTTRYRINQGLKSFLKPLYRVANSFKDAGFDLPMTIVNKIKSGLDKFTEGLSASGWKGLLTSMAAFLGMRWISENFEDKIKEITGKFTGADKKIDASLEKAKELANALTGGIIEKVQEKLEGMLKSFAGSAIEQLAGPLAWIKKIAEVLGTVDWVTSKLIGLISMGKFSASVGSAN